MACSSRRRVRPCVGEPYVSPRARPRNVPTRLTPRYRGAVPRTVFPIRFLVDDRSVAGETLYLDAGAQVLVLTTCSAELATRSLEAAVDTHTYERRRLLYDHLGRLQDLAGNAGHALAFEGIETAAAELDPLSPASR